MPSLDLTPDWTRRLDEASNVCVRLSLQQRTRSSHRSRFHEDQLADAYGATARAQNSRGSSRNRTALLSSRSSVLQDIGASLEDCKVARRVPNQEICAFWSNKIRAEQYILYNLPDGQPGRFPSNEQGTSSHFHYLTTNAATFSPATLLNTSDERFHSIIDKVSKDLAFVHRN